MILKGHIVKGVFEVFPSGGRWSLLFRKPLLKQFKAIHDYKHDTLMIPQDGIWTMLVNKLEGAPKFTETAESNANILKGDAKSPLRQVLSPLLMNAVHVVKQTSLKSYLEAKQSSEPTSTDKIKSCPGC